MHVFDVCTFDYCCAPIDRRGAILWAVRPLHAVRADDDRLRRIQVCAIPSVALRNVPALFPSSFHVNPYYCTQNVYALISSSFHISPFIVLQNAHILSPTFFLRHPFRCAAKGSHTNFKYFLPRSVHAVPNGLTKGSVLIFLSALQQ